MTGRVCSVDGCDRTDVVGRGWCDLHYCRWKRWGDPTALRYAEPPADGRCTVDGCDRAHYGRGWCQMHYQRWRTTGDALSEPRTTPGVVRSYHAMHRSVTYHRGKAAGYRCADCDAPAAHWSYRNGCDDERRDTSGPAVGVRWCPHPEHYAPRCVPCHRAYDSAADTVSAA